MRPLAAISLGTQLLASEGLETEVRAEQIKRLQKLSQRSIQLVESLLLVKTPASEQPNESANLVEVVGSAAEELKPWLDERRRPLKIYARPLTPLVTRRHAISNIIKTLVTADPTPSSNEPVEIRFRSGGAHQSVRIRDYNSQLTSGAWQRLHQPKFAAEVQPLPEDPNSSGFDLYVALQLAQQLGGQLAFEPKQIGNCFELKLPSLYQPQIWQATQW